MPPTTGSGFGRAPQLDPSRGGPVTAPRGRYGCPLDGAVKYAGEGAAGGLLRPAAPGDALTRLPETGGADAPAVAGLPPPAERGGADGCGGAPGLVHSQTSAKPIPLDPVAMRLSRVKRRTITAARLHQEAIQFGGFRGRWAFLTLTYAEADAWRPRHLPTLLDHIRKWLGRKGHAFGYVWVAEIQPGRYRRTGEAVIHYHVILWLPRGLTLPKPDKQGWWAHGSTKIEWARNPVGYMAKYSSKGDSPGRFPRGARIHGCGGLRGDQLAEARYWARPRWLREVTGQGDRVSRCFGGGWIDRQTGELYTSPWRVLFIGGSVWIQLVQQGPPS